MSQRSPLRGGRIKWGEVLDVHPTSSPAWKTQRKFTMKKSVMLIDYINTHPTLKSSESRRANTPDVQSQVVPQEASSSSSAPSPAGRQSSDGPNPDIPSEGRRGRRPQYMKMAERQWIENVREIAAYKSRSSMLEHESIVRVEDGRREIHGARRQRREQTRHHQVR